jgi:hypothetical protein
LVTGDDDAAFDEVDAVAESFRAGEIFSVPASRLIYHDVAFAVDFFYFPLGQVRILVRSHTS